VSLRERLKSASDREFDSLNIYRAFGVLDNPFPSSGQSSNNPHQVSQADEIIETKITSFIRDKKSQVLVIEGTQGVGKTNILNHYEKELSEALPELNGFYVIRYLADPEASFDGTLRRLFQELGVSHLSRLGKKLAENGTREAIEAARSHEMRTALQKLTNGNGAEDIADAMLEWLVGLRVLNRHKHLLGVQFRLDTVESKTVALRDLILVSSQIDILNGIFLLLDELEKQDGVLSATLVVRYLSAMRAIIDALPNHLFMMIAVTPDALRRYSLALPAFRSRLEDRIELLPLKTLDEAIDLATFYIDTAKEKAEKENNQKPPPSKVKPILTKDQMARIFETRLRSAQTRGDAGLRQREFLHALHTEAEESIKSVAQSA
jgi:hypothetical protein